MQKTTLIEFLYPLKQSTYRDKILTALYFKKHYQKIDKMNVAQIREALCNARTKNARMINYSDVLPKSGHFVDCQTTDKGENFWSITEAGEKHIKKALDLPDDCAEIKNNVETLSKLISHIKDKDSQEFVAESLECLRRGLLRASVVLLWSGAVSTLRQNIWGTGEENVSSAILKFDPKSRKITKFDDFSYVKDSILLLALQELGQIDKGERTTLEESLNLRNKCGHPTKYRPGPSRIASYIEDIVGIVFKSKTDL